MITDSILYEFSKKTNENKNSIWGNYDHIYSWVWVDDIARPAIVTNGEKHTLITSSVFLRDWTIAFMLKELGIKNVLDIGSDMGHFMAVLKACEIDSVGIDSNKKMCELIENKGVNKCYNMGIQDLVSIDSLSNKYDCIVCMNITQAIWKDSILKKKLIEWIIKNSKYAILSDMTSQFKKYNELELVHDFNLGRFTYNKFTQFIFRVLGVDNSIHYTSMQKLYKIKN